MDPINYLPLTVSAVKTVQDVHDLGEAVPVLRNLIRMAKADLAAFEAEYNATRTFANEFRMEDYERVTKDEITAIQDFLKEYQELLSSLEKFVYGDISSQKPPGTFLRFKMAVAGKAGPSVGGIPYKQQTLEAYRKRLSDHHSTIRNKAQAKQQPQRSPLDKIEFSRAVTLHFRDSRSL